MFQERGGSCRVGYGDYCSGDEQDYSQLPGDFDALPRLKYRLDPLLPSCLVSLLPNRLTL